MIVAVELAHGMRVDALQPIVVGDTLHDLCIGVGIDSVTPRLAEAFRRDEAFIELLPFIELWHLSAVQVETYVV